MDMSDFGPHLLGRDTAATMRHWEHISGILPVAPALMRGPRPAQSPRNRDHLNFRYAGQLIGCCVGESGAHGAEYLANKPTGKLPGQPPLTGVSVSSLHVYYHGRQEMRRRGIDLGEEGCVVSIAAAAAQATGFCEWRLYPTTDDAYKSYSDSAPPPQPAEQEGKVHRLLTMAQVRSFDQLLDYLSQGYVAWVGKPVREGIMSTDPTGYYRCDVGQVVGGHATLLVDYNESANVIWEFNSWSNARWGAQREQADIPSDVTLDPRCEGYTNLGHTDLDAMARIFSDSAFASGEVEAIVMTSEEQFVPLDPTPKPKPTPGPTPGPTPHPPAPQPGGLHRLEPGGPMVVVQVPAGGVARFGLDVSAEADFVLLTGAAPGPVAIAVGPAGGAIDTVITLVFGWGAIRARAGSWEFQVRTGGGRAGSAWLRVLSFGEGHAMLGTNPMEIPASDPSADSPNGL